MIKETNGNLFEAKTEAIINAVNCVGVMSKGLALQFRKNFPEDYFKAYKTACQNGELKIGKVHVYALNNDTNPKYIIDFPTKDHWREKSKPEYIESGLQSLIETIEKRKIKSIALPALGCGLGGLNYKEVRVLIEKAFVHISNIEVFLFMPNYDR